MALFNRVVFTETKPHFWQLKGKYESQLKVCLPPPTVTLVENPHGHSARCTAPMAFYFEPCDYILYFEDKRIS